VSDFPQAAGPNEVILGQDDDDHYVFLPLIKDGPMQGVNVSLVTVYPPKQVAGDFTRDSHQLLSSLIQSSWIGGGQIYTSQESTDIERFWWALADTRYPHALVLPPLVTSVSGPNDDGCRMLGDYADKTLAAYGNRLREVETGTASGGATLTATPVGKGVSFRGTGGTTWFYIPLGASGHDRWNGTAITNDNAVLAVDFTIFDNRLYALCSDGTIKVTTDGTTWASAGVSLDRSYTPRHIVTFYDRQDNPCMHVITERDVWAIDPNEPAIYRTELQYPPHDEQGLAAAVWRTDLYTSVGLGVHRYTGSVITAQGPDRDEGLPLAFRGRIVDFASEYNGLFCLVRGAPASSGTEESLELDTGLGGEEFYTPLSGSAASCLLVWDGFGWHTLWTASEVADPTTMIVSAGGSGYRLWWGFGGDAYYMDLPLSYQNPKQVETNAYAASGYLETSWFDMQMTGTEKSLASIETFTSNCSSTEYVDISYAVDGATSWTYLGRVTTDGKNTIRFGRNGSHPDGTARYDAVSFERVRFRFDLARGSDTTQTPILESFAIAFRKQMGVLKAFEFVVDLSLDGVYKGRGNDDLRRYIEGLVDDVTNLPFSYDNRWYDVTVTGVSGLDRTGQSLQGSRRVNVVQSQEL